jgi:hypothetical protein
LPAPPLGLAKTMVGIGIAPPAIGGGKVAGSYQKCNGYPKGILLLGVVLRPFVGCIAKPGLG